MVADGRVVSRSKRLLEAAWFLWVGVVMVMGIHLRGAHHDWHGSNQGSQKDTQCLDRQWKHTQELVRAHEVNL